LWANHTILLQICDVRLWRQGQLLNHESTLAPLLQADSATIAIANTKNGTKGVVVHHDAIGGSCCPVAALAQQIANLHGMQPTTPFITLCLPRTGTSQITDRDITIVVLWGATFNQLLSRGYTFDCVSSHSLRAGGTMAMKLSGATDSTIMRIGRRTSLMYLTQTSTCRLELSQQAWLGRCRQPSHSKMSAKSSSGWLTSWLAQELT
jgi:hypothetical protein